MAAKNLAQSFIAVIQALKGVTVTDPLPAQALQTYMPCGTVLSYLGAAAPTGFVLCDGTAYSRTDYANLFAVIGTTYGVGDGSTTFNVPNFQSCFLRGAGSQTVGGRTYTPAALGTPQADGFRQTTLGVACFNGAASNLSALQGELSAAPAGGNAAFAGGGGNPNTATTYTLGSINETRPLNYSVNYIIAT